MSLSLELQKRDKFGKKARKLIDEGQVLLNIFGKGVDSLAASGDYKTVNNIVAEAGKNHPIDLTVGKEAHLVLINDIERDPITQRLHHVALQVIHKGQKVTAEVPIKLVGDAAAEKQGRIVVTLMDKIEIESIPSNIPEVIEIDISGLDEEGDQITVADIKVASTVEILVDDALLIAKVDVPRAQVEEEDDEEEASADAADVPSDHGSGDDSEADNKEG